MDSSEPSTSTGDETKTFTSSSDQSGEDSSLKG